MSPTECALSRALAARDNDAAEELLRSAWSLLSSANPSAAQHTKGPDMKMHAGESLIIETTTGQKVRISVDESADGSMLQLATQPNITKMLVVSNKDNSVLVKLLRAQ